MNRMESLCFSRDFPLFIKYFSLFRFCLLLFRYVSGIIKHNNRFETGTIIPPGKQMNSRTQQIISGKMAPTPKYARFDDNEIMLDDTIEFVIDAPDASELWREEIEREINRYWQIAPRLLFRSSSPALSRREGYELAIDHSGVAIRAGSRQGVRFALATLRQLAESERGVYKTEHYTLPQGEVKDYPQFDFRGMHLCVFPETGLVELEKAIRLSAYYKFNHIIIEFWGTFPFRSHPEFRIPGHALTDDALDKLLKLGQSLGIGFIPQFNLLGHAAGSRVCSGKHVVLDRHPELQSLFEPTGWSWCLSNPEALRVQTELVEELCDRFAPLEFFHIGFDEAYDAASCSRCRRREVKTLLNDRLMYFHRHLGSRNIRMIMWHDMLLNYKDPRWTGYMAGGTPEERTYELLDCIPRDIVIADWQYEYCGAKVEGKEPDWPTLKYFKERGFPVLATSFNSEANIRSLGREAAAQQIWGVLGTSWHLITASMYEIFYNTALTAWGQPEYYKHGRLSFNAHLQQLGRDMELHDYHDFGCMKKQI